MIDSELPKSTAAVEASFNSTFQGVRKAKYERGFTDSWFDDW